VRNTGVENVPSGGRNGYVIRVVNTEVGAGEDLLRVIGINDDRIHRNVRQIAGFVRPDERATIRSTGYLEHVARRAWRVRVKAAHSRIANRHIHRWRGWIEGDAKDRTVRQNAVTACHVHPIPLGGESSTKVEANLHVAIVRPDDGDALILR
jgi:hypothetical protein